MKEVGLQEVKSVEPVEERLNKVLERTILGD